MKTVDSQQGRRQGLSICESIYRGYEFIRRHSQLAVSDGSYLSSAAMALSHFALDH